MGVGIIDVARRKGLLMALGSDETLAGTGPGTANAPDETVAKPDYDRDLGVVEAIVCVSRSCPSGAVVSVAERALDAIQAGGPDAIKQQAYFVLTALQGWRGERATQVHRSLTRYLAEG